jgi:hypothetical protein
MSATSGQTAMHIDSIPTPPDQQLYEYDPTSIISSYQRVYPIQDPEEIVIPYLEMPDHCPTQVNTSTHPNFISILVEGLPTDDFGRPDFGEVKDMAARLAEQIQTVQTRGATAAGTPSAAHVTDIYAEYSKFFFDNKPRFMGVLRAATRLFPSTAVANTLPGYYRFNDVCFRMQYPGRINHCPRCRDRNRGRPHTAKACPRKSCYRCRATGHFKRNCPMNRPTPQR